MCASYRSGEHHRLKRRPGIAVVKIEDQNLVEVSGGQKPSPVTSLAFHAFFTVDDQDVIKLLFWRKPLTETWLKYCIFGSRRLSDNQTVA